MDRVETRDSVRTGGATFGYASRQAGSGVPGPGGVMSCSEVMYQYYPYLYQRPPPPPHPTHSHTAPHTHAHANPHEAPFQSFSAATATHQYERVSANYYSSYFAGESVLWFIQSGALFSRGRVLLSRIQWYV